MESARPAGRGPALREIYMKRICSLIALALACSLALWAQPQPKSQEELDAIMAIQNAQDADGRIAAAEKLLTDFKDTEFKEFANYMMMLSYQQKNDFENMMMYGELTLEHNPDNVGVLLQLSYAIPLRTREFDLDKEEKLAKSEDFAKRAFTLVPNLPKPDPNLPDEEWLLTKKDFMAQANESLGLVSLKREDYAGAADNFQKALDLAPQQNATTFYYMAQALHKGGDKTRALTAVESAIKLCSANPNTCVGLEPEALKKEIEAGS